MCGRVTRGGCLPQNVLKLLADDATAPLVKGLITHDSGIARLENDRWLAVSAPLDRDCGAGLARVRGCAGG